MEVQFSQGPLGGNSVVSLEERWQEKTSEKQKHFCKVLCLSLTYFTSQFHIHSIVAAQHYTTKQYNCLVAWGVMSVIRRKEWDVVIETWRPKVGEIGCGLQKRATTGRLLLYCWSPTNGQPFILVFFLNLNKIVISTFLYLKPIYLDTKTSHLCV